MKILFGMLDKQSPMLVWWIALLMAVMIASLDVIIGQHITLAPLLFLPVVLVSWYGSSAAGISLAAVSAMAWMIASGLVNTRVAMWLLFVNGCIHFVAYFLLATIITKLRRIHQIEVIAADTDGLTQLLNPRGFYLQLANELLRAVRYNRVFSLAYIDIDNFKAINDLQGHAMGDKLLAEVAASLRASLRASDAVARMGGDEFACLLSETGADEAGMVFSKVRTNLSQNMARYHWPVGFSIGMVTFETPPATIDVAMKIADVLMYSVKQDLKNNIQHGVWCKTRGSEGHLTEYAGKQL